MKLLRASVLFLFIGVFILSAGATALAATENWATDPANGTKICLVFVTDDWTLVSATWSGPALDGKAEGQGKLAYVLKGKDGKEIKAQADAEMKGGKLNGKASVKWSDGQSFDGYYQDGLRHGQGTLRHVDGILYEGEFKNGAKEGLGVQKWPNGNTYQGEWKNGTIDGQGTYRWANGNIYQGQFKNGMSEGKGVTKFASGDTYEGEYKNDSFDGQGIYRWADGRVYRGEFKNGVREGQGIMTDAAGKVIHEGLWKNDKPAGGAGAGSSPGPARPVSKPTRCWASPGAPPRTTSGA